MNSPKEFVEYGVILIMTVESDSDNCNLFYLADLHFSKLDI